ncbi:DUF6233 domain-containing protein [Streptomyces goshikiensis]|uniref:DUF6233 domain-containing protein n=1 Tax=Streptomyces goshikiensis TaxID=1942 RepID=UPI0036880489
MPARSTPRRSGAGLRRIRSNGGSSTASAYAIPHTPERAHTGDCPMTSRGRPATAQSVREIQLTMPGVLACPLCRPDSELGLLDT